MPYYERIHSIVKTYATSLCPTQVANLALLVSAILTARTLSLSALARSYPWPSQRRVPEPKHHFFYPLKRLWRFLNNPRVDPLRVQTTLVPYVVSKLGKPRWLALALDWTMFQAPGGNYQVLGIAIARRGRGIPLVHLAYERRHLPKSQNHLEEQALWAVIAALPSGVRPLVLADRGFGRAEFFANLQQRGVAYVIRVGRGVVLTLALGQRLKLGPALVRPGRQKLLAGVHYGLWHGRLRDLKVHLVLSWQKPIGPRRNAGRSRLTREPWFLVSSVADIGWAVKWYKQRFWIEHTFKQSKGGYNGMVGFGLHQVEVQQGERLGRLVLGLSPALLWLCLLALPQVRALPKGFARRVIARGELSLFSLGLAYLDRFRTIPDQLLPSPS
jgi:hypothetical protein